METIETPKRAMLVIPHPDDGESGCAGTIAQWVQDGCEVLYIVCTNGDKGSSDLEMTSSRLAEIRESEQRLAADRLGITQVIFLGYGDGELEDTREFRGHIVEHIRRFRPDVVLAMDPKRQSHSHRDHRVSGQVALDACFPFARDFLHYPEHGEAGLMTHKVPTVLLWGSDSPEVVVDVSATISMKIHALSAHESQLSPDLTRIEAFAKRRAEQAAEEAASHGFAFEHAEVFGRVQFRI